MQETVQYPQPQPVILFTPSQRKEPARMRTLADRTTPQEKILIALAEFDHLTSLQVTRLLYSPGSLTYVQVKLKSLVAAGFVLALGGRAVNLPLIYTLSSKGRQYLAGMGTLTPQRFRPSEEREKTANFFFMKHALAVTDVLIGARLLSQTVPGITLNRVYRERELRRTIYVALPERSNGGIPRKICVEPDASLDLTIEETWHEEPQTFRDFFHIEVYRHLPMEIRFKQKVKGYVYYAAIGQHEELFHTSALSVAIFAATDQQKAVLKRWTEEALQDMPQQGVRFFFRSIDTSTASPTEMYLAPVWQQAFSSTPTPLLVLEEEANEQ